MQKNKEYKKIVDLLIEKKDVEARAELKRIMLKNEKYITYKNQLKSMGLDFKICDVDENVFNNLHEVIKSYPKQAKLKIIDELYLKIAKGD